VSATSPATGAATKTKRREADGPADATTEAGGRVAIQLEHARGHHARWLLIGGVLGALCILKLGTLGQGIGVVLVVKALWDGFQLVRTYLNPPGTIVVDEDRVSLPRGLNRGAPVELDRKAIASAYFLRRSVPWTRAAPVLVIEAGGQAYVYPRDWFASEADQRRILEALAVP
jgi:hypothetical protein